MSTCITAVGAAAVAARSRRKWREGEEDEHYGFSLFTVPLTNYVGMKLLNGGNERQKTETTAPLTWPF
jgi:hypothetical protein